MEKWNNAASKTSAWLLFLCVGFDDLFFLILGQLLVFSVREARMINENY